MKYKTIAIEIDLMAAHKCVAQFEMNDGAGVKR